MIPENGRFEFLGSTGTLSATETSIPVGTTHIIAGNTLAAANLSEQYGILAFKATSGGATQITGIPIGKFVRLYTTIVPGTSVLVTGTVGSIASTVTQVSFFKWSL